MVSTQICWARAPRGCSDVALTDEFPFCLFRSQFSAFWGRGSSFAWRPPFPSAFSVLARPSAPLSRSHASDPSFPKCFNFTQICLPTCLVYFRFLATGTSATFLSSSICLRSLSIWCFTQFSTFRSGRITLLKESNCFWQSFECDENGLVGVRQAHSRVRMRAEMSESSDWRDWWQAVIV